MNKNKFRLVIVISVLGLLLVVTVITVVGTVVTVERLDSLLGNAIFTGAATRGTGYINLTAASNNAITVAGESGHHQPNL